MTTRITRTTLVVAAMILPAVVTTVRADETFHDAETGITVSFPRGWAKIDDGKVSAYPIQKPAGGDAAYLAGYTRSGSTTSVTSPFVLIEARRQPWSLAGATYDDIQNKLHLTPLEDLKKSGQFDFKNRYKGDGLSPAAFDRDNNRILVQGVMTGPDGTGLFLYSVNFLGAGDMVRVNCYVQTERAEMLMPDFEKIVASFTFDQGAAYEPPAPPRSSRSSGYSRRGPLGGGVFVGVWLVAYLVRRWLRD